VVRTLLELWYPVVYTSLTTAVGFLAFLTTDLTAIRDFGLFTAVGILAALALSLSFVPACLTLAAEREAAPLETRTRVTERIGRWAGALSDVCRRRRKLVLGLCGLFILVSPLSVSRIRVQDSWIGNFAPQSPLARADDAINELFHGTHRLRVMLDTGRREGTYDPVLLREVEELQHRVEALEEVGGTLSVVDVLRRAGGWLSGDGGLPDSASGVAEALLAVSFLQGPEGLEPFLDAEHRRLHLSIFLRHADYRRTQRVVETLQDFARDRWAGRVEMELGGDARVSQAAVDSVVADQLRGLVSALAGVLVLLVALLRSFRSALIVTLPIAMAVLLNLVIMGLVDLPLGIATSMFSAVSVGIGVDYALHLWWCGSHAGAADSSASVASVTRAVTLNALVVSTGFLALLVSRTPPVRDLGALVGVAMGASLLFAVTLLPALTPAAPSSSSVGSGSVAQA
jgi:predicted RND superfamily exporter protein